MSFPPSTHIPPLVSASGRQELEDQEQQQTVERSTSELLRLLEQRDEEIRALKLELHKYKLALRQTQLDYHHQQQPQFIRQSDKAKNLLEVVDITSVNLEPEVTTTTLLFENLVPSSCQTLIDDVSESNPDDQSGQLTDEVSDTAVVESNLVKESPSQSARFRNRSSVASLGSNVSATSSRLQYKTTDANDGANSNDNTNINTEDNGDNIADYSASREDIDESLPSEQIRSPDGLHDIIQDVGEIDLDLELPGSKSSNQDVIEASNNSVAEARGPNRSQARELGDEDLDENDGDDIISDGLLTSLTDAAINNLSQLAALQERCESQQHSQQHQQSQVQHHQQQQQQQQAQAAHTHQQQSQSQQAPGRISSTTGKSDAASTSTTLIRAPSSGSARLGPVGGRSGQSVGLAGTATTSSHQQHEQVFNLHDPFSAAMSNQAGSLNQRVASINTRSQHQDNSSSISPSSTHQADLSTSHSLANVVAAAAVAAAAANDQHDQQQQHRPAHPIHSTPQSRLISSALASPEFYHSLQQQHSHAQQAGLQRQISPISSLHYSPSMSITPSPSSLLAQSRRPASNTSSSLLSPIASPNYLRRQFVSERVPMMSPSPTSLTTGSSSGASSGLAQILQQHQQQHRGLQQRSASAMAGPISTSSGTSISGTGSSAVSPLLTSKSSSQARLNNMQIRHKFGYLGSGRAQFNSPHGFCLGLNQEIVVADTNNHRVCIFDKDGTYITQFGSPGKEEGQLWNPRKVAILHRQVTGSSVSNDNNPGASASSQQRLGQLAAPGQSVAGSSYTSPFSMASNNLQAANVSGAGQSQFATEPLYVVCDRGAERSRMQIFSKEGTFIKKIGIHYIDIVAGLAITQNGLIIVVDSVSPTVYIINGETGSLNGWFDCSGHMKEPSDIAVKSDLPGNEYFICDFKGHCVVVFSEQGDYLRKIGHDGLTSYPNGIDISDDGDILVGDSHGNRFHVVVFDRNGNFVSQFECPHVKVSRCCGLKITREGYIVTLAKNNHHVLVLDTIHI